MDTALVVRPSRTAICTNALSKHVHLAADSVNQSHATSNRIDAVSKPGQEILEVSLPPLQKQCQDVTVCGPEKSVCFFRLVRPRQQGLAME